MKQMITISNENPSELINIIESYRATGWKIVMKDNCSVVLENDNEAYFKPSEYQTNASMKDVKC